MCVMIAFFLLSLSKLFYLSKKKIQHAHTLTCKRKKKKKGNRDDHNSFSSSSLHIIYANIF
jgi:hypothetical protein